MKKRIMLILVVGGFALFFTNRPEVSAIEKQKAEIEKIDSQLNDFQQLDYEQFTPAQLQEFNELNRKKMHLLQLRIQSKLRGSKHAKPAS